MVSNHKCTILKKVYIRVNASKIKFGIECRPVSSQQKLESIHYSYLY